MADVFISYKREDRAIAQRLASALEQLGFEVWWDLELLAGDKFRKVIREVIDKCSAAVVLWSAKSVESDFVMDEAGHAMRRGKLCPARIDDADLPFGFGQTHADDLSGWEGELTHAGFQSLVRSLEARTGRKARLGATQRAPEMESLNAELQEFQAAQLAGGVAALRAFLELHPRGAFASFVRGQIESMEAAASPGSSAAADLPASRPQAQAAAAAPDAPSAPRRPSTWPRIVGLLVASAAIVAYVLYERAQDEARQARQALAEQKERLDQELKARQDAEARASEVEAKAQQDRAAREQADRDRVEAQKADEQRLAREKAARERAASDAERQRQAAAPQAEQQRAARDAAAAEAQAKATPPQPFDLGALNQEVRAAADRARDAERRANVAAARARDAAAKARAGGERAPQSGLGFTVATGDAAGDEYAGYFENGLRHGVGVFVFGDNAKNKSNSLRYEGEYVNGRRSGFGVYYWRSGNRYAGSERDGRRNGAGVFRFADGTRFEGEYQDEKRSGYGVLWSAQGRVVEAGLYAEGRLTTPLGPQGR